MPYKINKNGSFEKLKPEKVKERNTAKEFDTKIAELTKDLTAEIAKNMELQSSIEKKDTEIAELTKSVEKLKTEIAKAKSK